MNSLGLLSVLGMVAITAGQSPSPECWYNALCAYNKDESFGVIPDTEDTMEKQMEWCQAQCFDDVTNPDCEHFTVHTSRGVPNCYLIGSCASSEIDACIEAETCNSGPKDCDSNLNCPMLTEAPGPGQINWQCDGDLNPYKQQVPEGETCFLSCSSWFDDSGTPAMVTSTCVGGIWETSVVSPSLTIPAIPDTLPQPDDAAVQQISCNCAPYNMNWDPLGDNIAYDPNKLPGTDFICSEDDYLSDDDADGRKEFVLKPTNVCRLFCDSYHIATIACENAMWTGEPELGAWCYYQPTTDDEVNIS